MKNLHNANPPDYASDRYAPARQHFIDNYGISHAQATQRLLDLWTTQNLLDRQDCDGLQEACAMQSHQEQEQACIQRDEAERLCLQEEEEFLPFADVPPPLTIPITPSPLALGKLHKGKFVFLYFFTNKGLADAQSISHSTDEDAYVLLPDEKGLHSFIPIASARAKQSVIEHQDLTWVQINEATH
ncbi:hypothetical protein OG21DRAFT_1489606 [Imleria badia]|nr:hypothetical protein OG21DRAFT_1489606 [Imleria badia]